MKKESKGEQQAHQNNMHNNLQNMSILKVLMKVLVKKKWTKFDLLMRPSRKIFSIYVYILFKILKSSAMYNIHRVPVYNCIKISLQGDLIYLTLSQRFFVKIFVMHKIIINQV